MRRVPLVAETARQCVIYWRRFEVVRAFRSLREFAGTVNTLSFHRLCISSD